MCRWCVFRGSLEREAETKQMQNQRLGLGSSCHKIKVIEMNNNSRHQSEFHKRTQMHIPPRQSRVWLLVPARHEIGEETHRDILFIIYGGHIMCYKRACRWLVLPLTVQDVHTWGFSNGDYQITLSYLRCICIYLLGIEKKHQLTIKDDI